MDMDEPDAKDVAAFEAWLTRLEQAPKELQSEFQKLVDWAIAEKEKYLPNTKLTDDEKKFYKIEMERLNNIFSLLRILNMNVTDDFLKTDIWHLVVQTFIAGINIGQYGEPIDPIMTELKRQRQVSAGKISGLARRHKAETGWQRHALELGIQSATCCPQKSLSSIADDITAGWKFTNPHCPSHDTLEEFLSKARKTGKLPRKIG